MPDRSRPSGFQCGFGCTHGCRWDAVGERVMTRDEKPQRTINVPSMARWVPGTDLPQFVHTDVELEPEEKS
jgi:hypothetical protein